MQVTLELSAKVTNATTYNILAETDGGREDRVVMVIILVQYVAMPILWGYYRLALIWILSQLGLESMMMGRTNIIIHLKCANELQPLQEWINDQPAHCYSNCKTKHQTPKQGR